MSIITGAGNNTGFNSTVAGVAGVPYTSRTRDGAVNSGYFTSAAGATALSLRADIASVGTATLFRMAAYVFDGTNWVLAAETADIAAPAATGGVIGGDINLAMAAGEGYQVFIRANGTYELSADTAAASTFESIPTATTFGAYPADLTPPNDPVTQSSIVIGVWMDDASIGATNIISESTIVESQGAIAGTGQGTHVLVCTAPAVVHFDSSGTTSTLGTSFVRMSHRFDFGDSANPSGTGEWQYPANAPASDRKKNEWVGLGVTAHLYETPGTYTVKHRIQDTDGTLVDAPDITVQVDTATYSGGVVALHLGTAGTTPGDVTASIDVSGGFPPFASNTKYYFQQGLDYSNLGRIWVRPDRHNILFSSYAAGTAGDGTDPITGDIDIDAGVNAPGPASLAALTSNITVEDINAGRFFTIAATQFCSFIRGQARNAANIGSAIGFWEAQATTVGATYPNNKLTAFVDTHIVTNSGSQLMTMQITGYKPVLVGVRVGTPTVLRTSDSKEPEHTIRAFHSSNGVYQYNQLDRPDDTLGGRCCIRLQSNGTDAFNPLFFGAADLSEFNSIERSTLIGWNTNTPFGTWIGPESSTTVQQVNTTGVYNNHYENWTSGTEIQFDGSELAYGGNTANRPLVYSEGTKVNGTIVSGPYYAAQALAYPAAFATAGPVPTVGVVNGNNDVLDGQVSVGVGFVDFVNDPTVANIKVSDGALLNYTYSTAFTGVTATAGIFNMPDASFLIGSSSATAGIPFSSSTFTVTLELTNGPETASRVITYVPKAGRAKTDILNAVKTPGSIFEGFTNTILDNDQVLYLTADSTTIAPDGAFTTNALDGATLNIIVFDQAAGEWVPHSLLLAPDIVPDSFSFAPVVGVNPGASNITSLPMTIAGVAAGIDIPVSIIGGEYSIDGGAYTSLGGQAQLGAQITVRTNASLQESASTSATLTVGSESATFVVTTADLTPAQFTFTPATGVALNSINVESNAIQVLEIDTPTTISIIGGEYSVDGGTFTSTSGTVALNSNVIVRTNAAGTADTTTTATLNIGGVTADFNVSTISTAPVISGLSAVTVNENQAFVYTYSASGTGPFIWSLSGTDVSEFSIDSSGTVIKNTNFDFEVRSSFAVIVNVEDSTGQTDSLSVVINVSNQQEATISDGGSITISYPYGAGGLARPNSVLDTWIAGFVASSGAPVTNNLPAGLLTNSSYVVTFLAPDAPFRQATLTLEEAVEVVAPGSDAHASGIITQARRFLGDVNKRRWSDPICVKALNHAFREIVRLAPKVIIRTQVLNTMTGTAQTLADAPLVIYALYKEQDHSVVYPTTVEVLSTEEPTWRTTTFTSTADHYLFDPETGNEELYLYPGAIGGEVYKIEYTPKWEVSSDFSDINTEVIGLKDKYVLGVAYYLAYLLLIEDYSQTGNVEKAASYRAAALEIFGVVNG